MSYYNGIAYTFTWEGRRLVGAVKGTKTMSFTYNDEGIRTSKTVNGVTHTYYLNGSLIMAEEWEDKLLVYLYDASGLPIGMMYRTDSYAEGSWDKFWFEKNLQGDVVAVYNNSGVKLATYTYDNSWGVHTVTYNNGGGSGPVQYNPFRYRGYYYDTDLEMHYLQSRYYDAKVCRFINADIYVSTGYGLIGNNMFAYCNNTPVSYIDTEGTFLMYTCDFDAGYDISDDAWLYGGGAGGLAGGVESSYYNYLVNSRTAAYDAGLGGYYSGSGFIGGYTAAFAFGLVGVTDSMAVSNGGYLNFKTKQPAIKLSIDF